MNTDTNKANDCSYNNSIQRICCCADLIGRSSTFDDLHKRVYFDLLHRIKQNCNILTKLLSREKDYLSIRLIQRSIVEDLITCFFFLSLDDLSFKCAIQIMNNKSESSINDWLKAHYEIDSANKKNNDEGYITIDEYLATFLEYVQKWKDIIGIEEVKHIIIKEKKIPFSRNPSEMKKITEENDFGKPIKWLYAEYRFLSQVEHYTPLNQGFSYYHNNDDTIKTHEKVIGFCINYLYDVIKELVNDNN